MKFTSIYSFIGIAFLSMVTLTAAQGDDHWSAGELEIIKSLSLGELGPIPEDSSNRVAEDPLAVELGHRL